MKLRRQFILAALTVGWVLLPSALFALGEFDGFWVGTEDIYVAGEHERATVPTVVYQQSDSELYFWDDYFGAVRLVKSGNQWVLPAPLEAEFWGYEVVITSMSIIFRSQSSLSGTINASVTGYNVTARAAIAATKQSCSVLSNAQTLSNQSGTEDSFKCYQIELPENARDLQVETWGGSGDCDLGVIYGRPDFDFDISEGDFNDELVVFPNPQSGRWYIGLYGFESYSGVNLQASFEEVPEVAAQFAMDTWFGPAPLLINFSDQSSGNITSWFWNFGDGSNGYEQNPSHTYAATGIYTVTLTVSGPDGSDTKTVSNLVRVYSADTRSAVEDFVSRFYSFCLSRDPDPSGLDYWVLSLLDGSRTGADVARGFVLSQEFANLNVSDDQYLRILYRAFFDREPDAGGYTYWLAKLQAGEGRDEILNGFIFATEFANLCGSYGITPSKDLTPVEAFVTRFYQQCLGRLPEPLGLDYWVSSLLDGSRTGADVAFGFVFSQEFLNRSVDNATYLTILYRAFFDREPDSGGFTGWYTQLQQGVSRESVLNGFLGAQEFFNLCSQYGITPQ